MICQHPYESEKSWQCSEWRGDCDHLLTFYTEQKAKHWCITLQHNYWLHSDKIRGTTIMQHVYQENLLVIQVPRCPLLIIWTRINKPFSAHLRSLLPLFTIRWKTGNKQVSSPEPVQVTLQTEHTLQKRYCNFSHCCPAYFYRTSSSILFQENRKKVSSKT